MPTGFPWSGHLPAAFVAVLSACAVPVPPSGGPADTRPPALVSSLPVDGQVGVATDRIVLRFDEFIDERSAAGTVTITPAPARAPSISYRGREIELRFDGPLRDSTTFIVTIDSGFRDAHGVALEAPIRIAFSTGAEIDRGRLSGRVVEWDRGLAAAGIDVYAFDWPVDFHSAPVDPAYRTQTDREGAFSFAYLPARRYTVLALRDANRNRRVDPGEWLAVPPEPFLVADSAFATVTTPWVLSGADAEAPEIRRVDALSDSRLQVRFSEPVRLIDRSGSGWTVGDSTGFVSVPVLRVYAGSADDRSVFVVADPMPGGALQLRLDRAVADTAANAAVGPARDFVASNRPDTVIARLTSVSVDSLVVDGSSRLRGALVLAPWSAPTLVFDHGPDRDSLAASLSVSDTNGVAVSFGLESSDGIRWVLRPLADAGPWQISWTDAASVRFDTLGARRFVAAPAAALGELAGPVAATESSLKVTLVPETDSDEPDRTVPVDASGRFLFEGLPGGSNYRLRVFADLDGDGRWSPGSLVPLKSAEPIGWSDGPTTVRARWETVVSDTLRIGRPPAAGATSIPAGPPPPDDPDS